jgi:hypothetical protein
MDLVIDNDIRHFTKATELPHDLEAIEPGPRLAGLLAAADRSLLSDGELVRLLVARDRLVSHLQYERAKDIATVAARAEHEEFASLEVGAALHLTGMAADHEVAFAFDLTERLPQVGALLAGGEIDVRRARVLVDGTAHLAPDVARAMVAEVAARAAELTTGQLRALIRRRCLLLDPDGAAEQIERAVEDRRLVVEATPWGTADLLLLDLPPDGAVEARERIEFLARLLPADGRTMDQRRADVALDLLRGHGVPVGKGVVDITVDLTTLLGLSEQPGEIGGWGPVVADVSRAVIDRHTDGRWQATVVDEAGDPLAVALRRRPTAFQARQVRARNRTCVFPGCRRSARNADLDHMRRYADGGPTCESNLAPLCERHHRAKDEGGWRYRRRPDGAYAWTSPMGRSYVTAGRSP